MLDVTMLLGDVDIQAQPATQGGVTAAPAPVNGGGAVVGPATGPGATSQAASNPATTLTATTASAPEAGKTRGPLDMLGSVWPIILIFGLLYLVLFRPQRKEEKNRKKMVEQMKRGDEVMTIGGLVGKVVEVKEDRVVIKVDESTNVKETYLKSAIQRVLTPGDKDA